MTPKELIHSIEDLIKGCELTPDELNPCRTCCWFSRDFGFKIFDVGSGPDNCSKYKIKAHPDDIRFCWEY